MKTYVDPTLENKIRTHLSSLEGQDIEAGDLFSIDQFHLGGPIAIEQLAEIANLHSQNHILDLGAGFGGASRLMAIKTGCRVTGIELCPDYVKTANILNAACNLSGQVTCIEGDITELSETNEQFDGALLSHVQMNIPDKEKLARSIHSKLVKDAPLMIWEVFSQNPQKVTYPMGWSIDSTDSFLCSADEMADSLQSNGFSISTWDTNPSWVMEWAKNIVENGPPPGLNLPALLPNGMVRLSNMLKGILTGELQVVKGVAHAN